MFLIIASSRIINPYETDEVYPWMAFLLIQAQEKPKRPGETTNQEDALPGTCTGSVISRR